mmetsp:Transcript_34889/g.31411  ORF Transcript_34889/g.31411 Transcript_34889/m.31411 type:complete len:238 (-) Transcript_34889:869-1582(-)
MKPPELLQCDYKEIKLFDGIDPNDISQGCLGVCYFLATLSATAEFPARLIRCFITRVANPYGIYSVRFFVKGIPTEVIVDDYVPCYENSHEPLFSKPKGKELWVLMLEKAFCKLYGSYTKTESGHPDKAMEYLHGCPSTWYSTDDQTEEEVWDTIDKADKQNFLLVCSTRNNVDERLGLITGHAYTVIGTHFAQGNRLLHIRNPWGKVEWTGEYSDKSPLWTSSLKREVNHIDAEDG